jgi:hypothetical protein
MPQTVAEMLSDLEFLVRRSIDYFGQFRVDRRLTPSSQAERTSALAALGVAKSHCQRLRVHSLDPVSLLDLVTALERAWGYWRPYRRNRRFSKENQAERVRAMTGLEMAVGLAQRLKARLDPLPWHAFLDAAPSPPAEAPVEVPEIELSEVESEDAVAAGSERGRYSTASPCYSPTSP